MGSAACSGDLLLGALAACAQITCQMVATAMNPHEEHRGRRGRHPGSRRHSRHLQGISRRLRDRPSRPQDRRPRGDGRTTRFPPREDRAILRRPPDPRYPTKARNRVGSRRIRLKRLGQVAPAPVPRNSATATGSMILGSRHASSVERDRFAGLRWSSLKDEPSARETPETSKELPATMPSFSTGGARPAGTWDHGSGSNTSAGRASSRCRCYEGGQG